MGSLKKIITKTVVVKPKHR